MNEEHLTLVEDCINREDRLTEWERGFIDSVQRQLLLGNRLTDKQAEVLERIWEKVT